MFSRTNYRAAIATSLLCVLLVPDVTFPQDPGPVENPGTSAAAMAFKYASALCAQQEEPAPLAQRVLLAGEACSTLPRGGWTNGICLRGDVSANSCKNEEKHIQTQLLAMGKRGETIARIREQVLGILQDSNACAAWYQEANSDPAATFRSLKFVLDEDGPAFVQSTRAGGEGLRFKHPYVASTYQNAGPNATIQVNAHGAFFNHATAVFEESPNGGPARPGGMRTLRVDYYMGDTNEAQLTAMLHELGHIVSRIPEDTDSFEGQSGRNTAEVLRHCRPQIQLMARKNHP